VIDGSHKIQLIALERGLRDGVSAVLRAYAFDRDARVALDAIERGVRDTLAVLRDADADAISPLVKGEPR
jgi:type III secretion protein L